MNRLTSCKVLTEKDAVKKPNWLASCLFVSCNRLEAMHFHVSVSAGKEQLLARKELSYAESSQYSMHSVEITIVTATCDVQNGRQSSFFSRIRVLPGRWFKCSLSGFQKRNRTSKRFESN